MILQALKEYYDRQVEIPGSGISPFGWEFREIPFITVLDDAGTLVQFEDTREGQGGDRRGKTFMVPAPVKRASNIAANLLWDGPAYVFGVDPEAKPKRLEKQHQAFVDRIVKELGELEEMQPLITFMQKLDTQVLEAQPLWSEIIEARRPVAFRMQGGQMLLCELPKVRECIDLLAKQTSDDGQQGQCLVTGGRTTIATLHPALRGVWGAQPTGANVVSFNLPAFASYKKTQGENAPIGVEAAFGYTAGLNHLLRRGSRQSMHLGDSTVVFWSQADTSFEDHFSDFFSEPPKDEPNRNVERVRSLLASAETGAYEDDKGDTVFYVLGLSPNAGRASVRFWQHGPIFSFAEKIATHFTDLQILKPKHEPEHYSLWRLLVNTATLDRSENIPPNLAGHTLRAVLTGGLYPATLLQAALRRIRADVEYRVKPVRAALIKAYLNRYHRIHGSPNHKEIDMALDVDQPSQGYQLGRLFAVLEKIQEEGNPGLNSTIRERFYGAACASPVTVFANLMRLKNHHLSKLENRGRATNFERLLGEIIGHFDDFPAHLDLHEQGRFAVGYYHQRQDFFKGSEHKEQAA